MELNVFARRKEDRSGRIVFTGDLTGCFSFCYDMEDQYHDISICHDDGRRLMLFREDGEPKRIFYQWDGVTPKT